MQKKVAITGGIGSGKSTVSEIIKKSGYPVFSCDEIYGELLSDTAYIETLRTRFPSAVRNGKIDKKQLGKIVFSDEKARAELDSIAHPMIMRNLFSKMKNSGKDLMFAEVPLLFEGNFEKDFDGIIFVKRNRAERIAAVCRRDNVSENEVLSRINAQFPYDTIEGETYLRSLNAYTVNNSDSLKELEKQVARILSDLEKREM